MRNGLDANSAFPGAQPADQRILHRLSLATGPTPEGADPVAGVGVMVAVKTTGLDHTSDVVLELSARRFTYDEDHVITRLDRPYVWHRDPSWPTQDLAALPGVVEGASIDCVEAEKVIGSANVRIAHNAMFVRPFVDALLPAIEGMSWACSIEDIGWQGRGYESSKLGWILSQCGYFTDADEVHADVDAGIQILRSRLEPGRTALAILMENGSRDGWLVRAFGASYHVKGRLKERGYRWSPTEKVWWKEVRDREAEETWLDAQIYDGHYRSTGQRADFEGVTWSSRYAR